MSNEIKAKYKINIKNPLSGCLKPYNLTLFIDTLPQMKKKLLKALKLTKESPNSFIFSITYQNNVFPINNEDDLYFLISTHLQSQSEDTLIIDIQPIKLSKKALLAKETLNNNPDKPMDSVYNDEIEVFCVFCKESSKNEALFEDLGLLYGPFKSKGKDHYCHERCAIWTPDVYLDQNNSFKNLPKEIKRSRKIVCSYCGVMGGGLGCSVSTCKKSYHFKCSLDEDLDCVLDYKNYTLYCPDHADKAPIVENLLYETIFCNKCGSGLDDEKLIICENCCKGVHIYCLDDQLEEVPEDDWFCDNCKQ